MSEGHQTWTKETLKPSRALSWAWDRNLSTGKEWSGLGAFQTGGLMMNPEGADRPLLLLQAQFLKQAVFVSWGIALSILSGQPPPGASGSQEP